jgi:NADH-ubiquinone oxidoreductase chain 5
MFSDLFVGIGTNTFESSLFVHPNHVAIVEAEFSLPLFYKLLPAILSVIGLSLSVIFYHNISNFYLEDTNNSILNKVPISVPRKVIFKKIYPFLNGKYLFDIIYNDYFSRKTLNWGYFVTNILERGTVEYLGPFGLSKYLLNSANTYSKLDTGIVTSYALYIVLGLISLIFIIFSPFLFNISILFEFKIFILYTIAFILYFQ